MPVSKPVDGPTVGRIVHYRLSAEDAKQINAWRAKWQAAPPNDWPFVAHHGNHAEAGQVFPAMVVRVFGDDEKAAANLQVTLDGNDHLWATSRTRGPGDGQWDWPVRSA